VGWFGAIRPGLLVLDADGRHVGALPLTGAPQAHNVVKWLETCEKRAPKETYALRVAPERRVALADALTEFGGKVVTRRTPNAKDTLHVQFEAATITPSDVLAIARKIDEGCFLRDPVAVQLSGAKGQTVDRDQLLSVAGVWSVTDGEQPTAYVSRILLRSEPLSERAKPLVPDIIARTYSFSSIPKGGGGHGVASAPLALDGVVTIVPEIFDDRVTVVSRKDLSDKAIRKTFSDNGTPAEK